MKAHCREMAVGLLVVVATMVCGAAEAAENPQIVAEVNGRVTDANGNGIEKTVVKVNPGDISPVLTNAEGRFKFYIVGENTPFTLTISKEGYAQHMSNPLAPREKVTYDVVLQLGVAGGVTVEMTEFRSGATITGRVSGIAPDETQNLKVVVYILTDQWYIHPYAENKAGRGFATINEDGSWSLSTTNRGHSPFRLGMVVLPRTTTPPATIRLTGDADAAEGDLRNRFGVNVKAMQVIDAPDGL